MDDGGCLGHDLAVGDRHPEVMAGLREIGGQPVRAHGFVEHVRSDTPQHRSIFRAQPPDFDRHLRAVYHTCHKTLTFT